MSVVSMKQLLEAGVHFGHQTRRWNPKMARYIFTERNGIYIIDLQKTVKKVEEAYAFIREVAASGAPILFVIPVAFKFLITFGGEVATAMPKIDEYVGFFTKLIIAFGISFELPVITFFLAKIGLITNKSLSEFFRYAIVVIFIFAAIMTPPDVLSQFMLAVPLIALYALSIFIAKCVNPYKEVNVD